MKEYGKTARSRRNVPLTNRALAAIDALTARIDTPLLFPAARGGFIDLDNWCRRDWRPRARRSGTRGHMIDAEEFLTGLD